MSASNILFPLFTEKNVLRIAPIADEYQVTVIVTKCKTAMKSIASKAQKNGNYWNKASYLKPLRECFNVLKSALSLNYTDISDVSVNAVARFGYCLYNDVQYIRDGNTSDINSKTGPNSDETYADVRNECISSFEGLPFEWQKKILLGRLGRTDEKCEFKQ